jgi:hypothetical protein
LIFYSNFVQTKKPTILIIVLQHSTPNNAPGVNRRTKLVSSQFVPASLNVHPDPKYSKESGILPTNIRAILGFNAVK